MTDATGPALLAIWLKTEGRKHGWMAEKVATSQKTFGWWLSSRAVPSAAQANHIDTITGGQVPASAWVVK